MPTRTCGECEWWDWDYDEERGDYRTFCGETGRDIILDMPCGCDCFQPRKEDDDAEN